MKREVTNIDGINYEVRELTARSVLEIMELDDGVSNLAVEMAKRSVYKDGKLMGDNVLDLPFSGYQALVDVVNGLHTSKND